MFSVKDEKNFDCADDSWVHSEVLVLRVLVHHIQEVLNVSKLLIRLVDFLADAVSVTSGSDCGSAS